MTSTVTCRPYICVEKCEKISVFDVGVKPLIGKTQARQLLKSGYDPCCRRHTWSFWGSSLIIIKITIIITTMINNRDFSFSTTDGSATVVHLNVVVFSTTKNHPKYCRRNWGTTVLKADACADDAKCHLTRRRTIRRRKRKVPIVVQTTMIWWQFVFDWIRLAWM